VCLYYKQYYKHILHPTNQHKKAMPFLFVGQITGNPFQSSQPQLNSSDRTAHLKSKTKYAAATNLAQNGGMLKKTNGSTYVGPVRTTSSALASAASYSELLDITKGKYLLTPPPSSKLDETFSPENGEVYYGSFTVTNYSNANVPVTALGFPTITTAGTPPATTYEYPNQLVATPATTPVTTPDTFNNSNIVVDPEYRLFYRKGTCNIRNYFKNVYLDPSSKPYNREQAQRIIANQAQSLRGFQYPTRVHFDLDNCGSKPSITPTAPDAPVISITSQVPTSPTNEYYTVTISWLYGFDGGSPITQYNIYGEAQTIAPQPCLNSHTMTVHCGTEIWITASNCVPGTGTDTCTTLTSPDSNHVFAPACPPPPLNETIPTINGSPYWWSTLQCSPGTWNPPATSTPTSYTYQWCATNDGQDVPLTNETNSSYTVSENDNGLHIRCRVVAINGGGSSLPARSDPFGPITPPPPLNETIPTINGSPYWWSTLQCSPGTWNPPATSTPTSYTYQWCATNDGQDVPLTNETNSSYTVSENDNGLHIRCRVVAINGGGSSLPARSDPFGPITSSPIAPTLYWPNEASLSVSDAGDSGTVSWTAGVIEFTSEGGGNIYGIPFPQSDSPGPITINAPTSIITGGASPNNNNNAAIFGLLGFDHLCLPAPPTATVFGDTMQVDRNPCYNGTTYLSVEVTQAAKDNYSSGSIVLSIVIHFVEGNDTIFFI
jgi:hypothetical protein